MSAEHDTSRQDTARQENPQRLMGLPSDLRRPTATRLRSRAWNPDDRGDPCEIEVGSAASLLRSLTAAEAGLAEPPPGRS
jgi:hypothetical protein